MHTHTWEHEVMELRTVIQLGKPVAAVVCAASCIVGYFQIAKSAISENSSIPPLPVGIYVSDDDAAALQRLSRQTSSSAAGWNVQVAGKDSGSVRIAVSFGRLALNQFGQPYGAATTELSGGTLPRPVTIAYVLPPGSAPSRRGEDEDGALVVDLNQPEPSVCASWTAADLKHVSVDMEWDSAGDGWPDLAVCRIPALQRVSDLSIYAATTVAAPALGESLSGASSLTVSNPQRFVTTMRQDDLATEMRSADAASYALRISPPPERSFADLQPPPNDAGAPDTRIWHVVPGGGVTANLIDERRRTLADVAEQTLLILAGFFFALFAASVKLSRRERTGDAAPTRSD